MYSRSLFLLILAAAFGMAAPAISSGQSGEQIQSQGQSGGQSASQDSPSFLRSPGWGADSQFNPATHLVNDAYDIFQLGAHRDIRFFRQPRAVDIRNIVDNLVHPIRNIRKFGTEDFLKYEIFSTEFSQETAQWVPNYSLHALGGVVMYGAVREWYATHGVNNPGLVAAATVTFESLVNEINENEGLEGPNGDAIADFYLFDLAGIALWHAEPVRNLLAGPLNAALWGRQPSILLSNGELRNVGMYYAMKWRLPKARGLHAFAYFGMGSLFGFSVPHSGDWHTSVGFGFRTREGVPLDPTRGLKTVSTGTAGGIFLDRGHSLMASLVMANIDTDILELNLYPGLWRGRNHPGLWVTIARDGTPRFGIVSRWGFGLGY